MATIIEKGTQYAGSVWKGGLAAGARTGFFQGGLGMIVHPFFARTIGGLISAAMEKDDVAKKVILMESSKEAIYQLLAGE
jgi:hypothetical protein